MPNSDHHGKRDLARAALKASFWSGADGIFRAAIGLAVTISLARLIPPGEFGIIAMVLLFTAIAGVLIDFGIGTALIQRRDAGPIDESTAFYFNVAMGLAMAAALVLAAPWIASFFAQPVLTGIAWIMAANLVAGCLGSIHSTLLSKALDFRPQAMIGLWSSLLSGILAVALAWKGYGAWALAWQILARTSINTALLWVMHPWRPMRSFSLPALNSLLAFGGHWMAARLIDAAYTRLYTVFIGKLFGASELGVFSRAHSTQQAPTTLMARVLNRVALPAFAEAASSPRRLGAALAKSSRLIMFVNLPAMVGLALTAEPLVQVLFGPRWLPAIPLLQILALAGTIWPLHVLNISALAALGHSRLLLRIEVIKKTAGVAALATSSPWGLEAIAWSQVLVAAISFFINSFYSGKLLGFGAWAQLKGISGNVAATLAMAVAVVALDVATSFTPALRLVALATIGVAIYLLASFLIGELSPVKVKETLRAWFPRRMGPKAGS